MNVWTLKYNPKDTTDMSMSNQNTKVMNNFDSVVNKNSMNGLNLFKLFVEQTVEI